MRQKLIAGLIISAFSMNMAIAQCSSAGSQWVGDNARNYTPGIAGSQGGGSSGGGGLGGMVGGSGSMGSMGNLGGWSGGSMGGSGSGSSSGGFMNGLANTVGLGSLTSDKEFTLSDAAKLASTATTVYGVAKGDNKAVALGMTGMVASNKFEGNIDNFGSSVANKFSSGSSSGQNCDAEFGCAGAFDKAVSQQAQSNVGSVFNSGSGSSNGSSFNLSGNDVKQYTALAGMAMTIGGNTQGGMQVAQMGNMAGNTMNVGQQISNGQMNGQTVQQMGQIAGQYSSMNGNYQQANTFNNMGNMGGQIMNINQQSGGQFNNQSTGQYANVIGNGMMMSGASSGNMTAVQQGGALSQMGSTVGQMNNSNSEFKGYDVAGQARYNATWPDGRSEPNSVFTSQQLATIEAERAQRAAERAQRASNR